MALKKQGERTVLIITRKIGERLYMIKNEQIVAEIILLTYRNGVGKVGIEVVDDYQIIRQELYKPGDENVNTN